MLKKKLESIIKSLADKMSYSDIKSAKGDADIWRDKNKGKNILEDLFFYFEYFYDILTAFINRKEYVNWKTAAISGNVKYFV